ncbi:MAG: NAD(P)H-hydrate dehydratase [Pseudomonadota bacterium]
MDAASYALGDLRGLLPPRLRDSHKGDFGHVLVIGGNHGMAGAARLAAEAAARLGAGLVSVATRDSHAHALGTGRPELMVHAAETDAALERLLDHATVIVLGPGLGCDAWARRVFDASLRSPVPQVVDADALNLLALTPFRVASSTMLTPHPGEAARLLGTDAATVQADRGGAARLLRERFGGTWILKGAGALVACEGGLHRCVHGHPAMASGGMGDVLSGILGALLAQGMGLCEAARLGVALHAAAGERAAVRDGGRGLLALDLLPYARSLLEETCPC